jgi:simple sugar transport system ATP-binding protein
MAAGIGMVHQHFMLIPVFTVAENVMLGHEQTGLGSSTSPPRAHVRAVAARFGFDVDPDALVGDLPVGVQQRVEIIKALSRDAKVLVFDEPTAVLTPQETDELMSIMKQLRDEGTAIVFITHKLREVRAVADRITVIRLGKVVGEAEPTASNTELASMMVGRPVELTVHKNPRTSARAASRSGTFASSAPTASSSSTTSASTCVPARSSPSPVCRATARPSSRRRSWV